jgi:hypothetical protein
MTSNDSQKISIAFTGGQVLTARVDSEELSKLRKALGSGGWHDVRTEDGTVALDLGRVLYVLVEDEEHRVGFGA